MTDKKTNAPVNDIYNVWDGSRYVFTLRKISQITGMAIPEEFTKDIDTPVADLRANGLLNGANSRANGLQVLFAYARPDEAQNERYKKYIEKGVILVSSDLLKDENGEPYPMIVLKSRIEVQNVFCAIGKYIKSIFPVPTIGVTGSVGKTTITRFLENIFSERFNVFTSGGNRNTADLFTNSIILRYGPKHTFHVQECGAGAPGLVERSANLISADAFCITNIFPQHLDHYKTIENILHDKTSFDRVSGKECFGVINIDNDMLRGHQFNHRIVTCGIEHTEADYVAKNIRQNGLLLELDITYKDNEATRTVPIKINIPGAHNANGAVMAFAMAKEWGLTDEEIQRGLLNYKSDNMWRQNIQEISGRTVYFDCFNSSTASLISTTKALAGMKKDGGRTIAVLGGLVAAGEFTYAVNYEAGLYMSDYDIDEFIVFGRKIPSDLEVKDYTNYEAGYALYQGVAKARRGRVTLCETVEEIANILAKETRAGDVILLKGSGYINFISIADVAFGTSYTFFDDIFAKPIWLNEGELRLCYYDVINGGSVTKCPADNGAVKIPNMIANRPVFRVARGLFRNRKDVTDIDFGRSVVNIGSFAFKGCKGIKRLELPLNVIRIEEEAFAECAGLETVIMPGVEHIGKNAFKNCEELKHVVLSGNCLTIEDGAFSGCKDLTVEATEGSYAKEFFNNTKMIQNN